MIDADTSAFIVKNKPASVKRQIDKYAMDQLCISVVTYAELIYGAELSSNAKRNREVIDDFVRFLTVYDWDSEAAAHYGKIRYEIGTSNNQLGAMDIMLAAHARTLNATVVTSRQRQFGKVRGLKTVDWTKTG